ncbi:MAG: hypothetical protein ACRC80_13095 [Waterburya sp.]
MSLVKIFSKFKPNLVYRKYSWSKIKFVKYRQWYVNRDLRWLLMFLFSRFSLGRDIATAFYRDRSLKINHNDHATSIFRDLEVNQAVASIQKNGYYAGLQLPQQQLQEILEYAYSADICVDRNPQLKFKLAEKEKAEAKYNQKILIGDYVEANSECLALKQLGNDSKLRAIATKYLKNKPILVRSHMGWCFTGEKEAYLQKGDIGIPVVKFHYDLDDYRALKFFFYLTDVDSLSGSHLCVAGSHKNRKLSHCISRSESDTNIVKYYTAKNIVSFCGQAGFGFAEDPFCFHRGSPPVTSSRLMIQLEFALHDYGKWN